MASQTDICNQALTKIGADRILAITDDTKAASTLNAIWAIKRDAELAAQPWTFAIRRASLPASTTTPSFGWSYAYPLPSDYLAMVEVGEDYAFYTGDPQPLFALEGGEVLTDQGSPLNIRYVSRVTNTGLYPALFAEALASASVVKPVLQLGLPDEFIEHGDPARLLSLQGLDAAGIEASVRQRFGELASAASPALKIVA